MIIACVMAVLGLLVIPPRPGVRAGVPGLTRIRAGPGSGAGATPGGWLDRLVPRGGVVHRAAGSDPLDTAADIDLFAACLGSGLSTRDAAGVVARVVNPGHRTVWEQAVALLSIGVGPDRAFASMAGVEGLEELATLAEVSHRSGSALSQGCHRIAQSLTGSAADHRTAAAERAGVFIALPLAACFLPAFMVLGLAPVVLGLGTKVMGQL